MSVNENPGILLYTRVRKSPYFYASRRHGVARYSVYNHTYHPRHYGDPVAEYWHLVNAVTLWDVGVEKQIQIKGKDAFDLTNMIVPRDLYKCAVDECKYVFITAPDGGILNDPVLTRMDENRFWLALASSDALLYAKGLAAHAGMDVELREADVHPLQVQGPKSKDVMRSLLGDGILDLKYYWFTETEIDGIPVVVTRTGWTSEVGYEVYLCDSSKGTELWEAIFRAGEPFDIRPTGPVDIRRIEGGIFNWGADMTYENNPYEMGLDRLVDLDVECTARDALRRISESGVERRIVGIQMDGERFPTLNNVKWPATHDGERVGKVTSACHSPRLEKNIGYVWLPAGLAREGTQLDVDTEWGSRRATVVPMPFIDPQKAIPVS